MHLPTTSNSKRHGEDDYQDDATDIAWLLATSHWRRQWNSSASTR